MENGPLKRPIKRSMKLSLIGIIAGCTYRNTYLNLVDIVRSSLITTNSSMRCIRNNLNHLPFAQQTICTRVKTGRFGIFSVLCFLALGGHCLQLLCLPGFRTHADSQNLPHFRGFPASVQEHCPPKCLFFMANAKLPNRPGFAPSCSTDHL